MLASWEAAYAAHGQALDRDDWLRTVGGEGHDRYDALAALVGEAFDREAAHARRRAHELELVAALAVRDGLEDCLRGALGLGLRLAVVSSSPRSWVEPHLVRLGLRPLFEALVCREDAPRAKPHPDLYLAALQRLGLSAEQALVVEDSANGVAAARAAGLRVVAVPNAVTRASDLSAAEAVLETVHLWEHLSTGPLRRSTLPA